MSHPPSETPAQTNRLLNFWQRVFKNYWLRTIVKKIFIVWVVVTFTFIIIRALPGNPVDIMVLNLMDSQGISEDEARMRAASLLRIDIDARPGDAGAGAATGPFVEQGSVARRDPQSLPCRRL